MRNDVWEDSEDLLAPIDCPDARSSSSIERHRLDRTSFCYLNPLPGLFVTITEWPTDDDSLFRMKGKRMISLLFPLEGDFILRDPVDEWTFAASTVGIVYRPQGSIFHIDRPRNVDVVCVGLHVTEEASRQDPLRETLSLICRELPDAFHSNACRGASIPISRDLYWRLVAFVAECRDEAGSTARRAISVLEIIDLLEGLLSGGESITVGTVGLMDEREQLVRCRGLIDANFDKPLTVEELAREAGMSRTKFNERFRQTFGVSPMAYLTELRMQNAKKMLAAGNARISQVAWAVGYSHPCNFAVAFKRHWGQSPKEYRCATDRVC